MKSSTSLKLRYAWLCVLSTSASIFAITPARAADPESAQLQEVIVTAERRETALQKTPAAVSSFNQDAIATFDTTDTRSLMGLVPNLYVGRVSTAPSTQTYGMRGLSQSDTVADPTVAVYIDDVYLPRSLGAMMDMPDLERIEVLRGPQGTLYGRNATAGAIKFISRNPSEALRANVAVEAGNLGQFNASAFVAGPIVGDAVMGSFTVYHTERNGYTDAPNMGRRKVNRINQDLLRGKLLFRPSDRFSIKLTADGFFDTSDASVYVAVTPPAGGVHDPYLSYERPAVPFAGIPLDLKEGGLSAEVAYDVTPELTLKSITAARAFKGPYLNANDGLPVSLIETYAIYDQGSQTQEFQLLGSFERLSFTVGLYYFGEIYKADTLSIGRFHLGITPSDAIVRQKTRSYAVYGQGTYEVTDQLSIILGGRYTTEKRTFSVENYRAPPPTFRPSALNYAVRDAVNEYEDFSSRVGVQYQFTPAVMAYANYSEAFQAGGFSFRAATASVAQAAFEPSYVTTYEAGLRSELFDRRARLNLTVFRNKVDNMQLTAFSPTLNAGTILNAGSARLQGVEAEASALLSRDLAVTASAAYLDAKYTRFDNPTGPGTSGVGLHPIFAPKWTAGVTAKYTVPVDLPGEMTLAADLRYQTKTYLDILNNPGSISPKQTFVNASASYRSADRHWTASVSVENLFDKAYPQFAFNIPTAGVFAQTFNLPRTVLFSVKYEY